MAERDLRTFSSGNQSDAEEEAPLWIPAKFWTRLWAELADVFIVWIASVLLFEVAYLPLFGYAASSERASAILQNLLTEQTSSYLYQKTATATLSESQMGEQWIKAYFEGNHANANGESTDFLFDYYHVYRKSGSFSVQDYNTAILGLPASLSENNASPYFRYDITLASPLDQLGVLQESVTSALKDYYAGKGTAEALLAHQNLTSFFTEHYETARNEFLSSEPYKTLFAHYLPALEESTLRMSGASLSAYFTSALLFFFVVPLIGHKGTSLGKKILKLDVRNSDGSLLHFHQTLRRALVESLEYLFVVPFVSILELGFDGLTLPLIVGAQFTLSQALLFFVGLALSLVSLLFAIFLKNHESLHGLASQSLVYTADPAIIASERARRAQIKEGERDG